MTQTKSTRPAKPKPKKYEEIDKISCYALDRRHIQCDLYKYNEEEEFDIPLPDIPVVENVLLHDNSFSQCQIKGDMITCSGMGYDGTHCTVYPKGAIVARIECKPEE